MNEDWILEEYKIIYGFDDVSLIEMNSKLGEFAYFLSNIEIDSEDFKLKNSSKKTELQKAKKFLNSRFVMHNVHYLSDKDLLKLDGIDIKDITDLINLYNRLGKNISCFKIPISYVDNSPFYGTVSQHLNICGYKEFLQNMKLYIKRIKLSKQITNVTGMCYVHELIHTQLCRERGMIRDFKNVEVLSIFMELVYCLEGSFDEKDLIYLIKRRIDYFILEFYKLFQYYFENDGKIRKIDALLSSKYVESIAIALQMFIIYIDISLLEKKVILESIQKVFDGDICLEDMLNNYGLSLEKSLNKDNINRLLKI